MAKGSMFWSKARGKVGDIVVSQVKGQTITRAYQPSVTNPKSEDQMLQRAKFGGAVKFYKFATQSLFKFAFEDKQQKESDYNAFMRYNAKLFAVMDREDYLNSNVFPVTQWGLDPILSQGRLGWRTTQVYPDVNPNNTSVWIPGQGEEIYFDANPTTWGELSQKYIDTYGLLDGDIITLVHINTGMVYQELSRDIESNPKWNIEQYILDSTSAAEIPEIFSFDADHYLRYTPDLENYFIQYFSVIFSRNTPNGLWVSTSNLAGNGTATQYANILNMEANIKRNLVSWGATGKAILQGSLAAPMPQPEPGPTIEGFRGLADVEDDAFESELTLPGNFLAKPLVGSSETYYIFVKGENLGSLHDNDIVFDEDLFDDAVWISPTTEHVGYRCIQLSVKEDVSEGLLVTISIKNIATFKVITS